MRESTANIKVDVLNLDRVRPLVDALYAIVELSPDESVVRARGIAKAALEAALGGQGGATE